jgi:hypothetical protein
MTKLQSFKSKALRYKSKFPTLRKNGEGRAIHTAVRNIGGLGSG